MIRCPKCSRPFLGDPQVVKAGKLYRCRCRWCMTSWDLDGNGERIKEKTDGHESASQGNRQ